MKPWIGAFKSWVKVGAEPVTRKSLVYPQVVPSNNVAKQWRADPVEDADPPYAMFLFRHAIT